MSRKTREDGTGRRGKEIEGVCNDYTRKEILVKENWSQFGGDMYCYMQTNK